MDYSKLSDQELRAILAQSSSDLAPASRDYSSMSDEELLALIQGGSAETPKTGRGGVLPSLAEGFVTSFTDIPLGIASIFSEAPEETAAGKFSTQAEKVVQDILGIDPNKEATTAEAVAGGLGSLASFLVPGTIAAKGAKALGAGATAIRGAGLTAAGAQAVPLGGAEQVQRRMAEEAATGVEVSGEDRLASQRLGAAIGLSELVPLRRFIGPLEEILTKIPLSKAGGAGEVVKRGVTRALGAATEEGAQEALSETAQNLVEQGYYNPDLDITEGLLASAGVGGAAGGTLDVILQLMSGRKAANLRKKAGQLQTTLAKQGSEKRPEQIRADANMGLDKLRAAAPVGNISIKREIPTTGIASFSVINERGEAVSSFSTPEAAVLAAEQYERDAGGLAKFNRPTIAEMSGQAATKPTKQEKAEGKKLAKALKQSGGLALAPAQTPTTPAGQAAAVQGVAQVADATGATPAEVASPTKPIIRGKRRIAPVEAAPAEGLPSPEGITAPPPVSTTAAEIPAPVTGRARQSILPVEEAPAPAAAQTPVAATATAAPVVAAQTAPASPTAAPPAAVPAPKAATPSKPFTTSIEALFKPIANTPEDMAKLADFNNRKKQIAKELNKKLSPITGKKTRVKLIDAVTFTDKAGRTAFAEGEAKGGNIIYLSYNLYDPNLTNEQLVDKLFDVMNHEVIHSLTNLGVFNPGETKTLFNAAERMKYQGNQFSYYDRAYAMYSRMPNYTAEMIREEAVAEMFRDYRSGKLKLEGTPKGLVQRAIEFFRRIFSGFRDAKVGQIFKDIESGKVGAREARPVKGEGRKFSVIQHPEEDWATAGMPPPGVDSQNQNDISPYRISQRTPRGKGREQESLNQDLEVSMASMMLAGDAFRHNAKEVLNSYGILPRIESEEPEATARRFIRHFADNLLWLHDSIPQNIRDRSKLWYDGARKITTELAQKYNVPDTAIAALIAAESPQKDWYQNVSLAERIADVIIDRRDFAFDDEMMKTARGMKALRPYMDLVNMMEGGATIENMENFLRRRKGNMIAAGLMSEQELQDSTKLAKAIFVRLYDETYKSRDYDIISPEGNKLGPATTKSGKNSRVAWGSFKEISKGVSVLEDPSKENINIMLGSKHKVRNFFNNILSPNAGSDLTSDTHAVAAAHLKPLGGGAIEVHHNFGTSKKGHVNAKNSGPFGVQGVYGFIADAYRLAAAERGILPREMQSITWEAIRGMYSPEMRRNKRIISLVNDVWSQYGKQEITLDEARNRLTEITDGIRPPSWARPDLGVPEDDGQASDTPDISGTQLRPGDEVGEPDSRAVVGSAKRVAEAAAVKAKNPNLSDSQLEDLAGQANEQVRKAVRKLSVLPQTIPMPPAMEAANERIFAAKYVPSSPGEKLMAFLNGFSSKEGIMRMTDMFRTYVVQKGGQITKREREAFLTEAQSKTFGGFTLEQAQFAEYSATAAWDMQSRASHYTVEVGYNGAPTIMSLNAKREQVRLSDGGDPNSAHMYVEANQKDSPFKVLEMIYEGGPNGESLIEQFRSYAIAQVSKRRLAEGKEIPSDITQEYIDGADALGEQFPIIKEAFESYQRFNTKLLEAVRDSGYLSQELFEEFTDQQNYYSMYRQLEEGDVVQTLSGGLGSRIRFKAYEGSTTGNLMADPIVAMMHNVSFWNNVILRTLATQKSFRVGEATGVVKRLRSFEDEDGNFTIEEPSRDEGFDDKKFYTYINGVEIPFASKDPLFTIGLSGNEFVSPGLMLEAAGMPADFLREMVTRDPSFMVANLLRDSVSTWVLAGSGANPYQTFKGMVSALKSSSSFNALRSHAVVGSFDEAQKPMAGIVAGMRGKLTKAQGLPTFNSVLKSGWSRLGSWSEASDAATRIAVYEAAKRDGASDFTAAYRALSIMNFSRSGHSATLRTLTRLIPFLNARIQGFDVLYTGLKAATGVVTGREQLEFERQRGTHVLVRGMGLMAAAMTLALINDDDEDYKQLPQYIKDANILIPIFGQQGKYIQIPKPFEAGFLFMTVPEAFYNVATGDRSMRSATKLVFNQFGSTFGFNPIPQVGLPIFENMLNYDFYTGQPLVSPGLEKLDTSLQYNASTSYVARGLSELSSFLPLNYDFEEGKFTQISPIKIDNLISGYGGPLISYVAMGVGGLAYAFGEDNQGLPVAGSRLPVIRRFFVDARDRQPQAATEAYELYQIVDKVNRTVSRLKKSGDTEALKEYREENINVLRVGKQVRKMADNLNNIRAQMRRLEADKVMPMNEKLEKMRELRSREARVTSKIDEINQMLGR